MALSSRTVAVLAAAVLLVAAVSAASDDDDDDDRTLEEIVEYPPGYESEANSEVGFVDVWGGEGDVRDHGCMGFHHFQNFGPPQTKYCNLPNATDPTPWWESPCPDVCTDICRKESDKNDDDRRRKMLSSSRHAASPFSSRRLLSGGDDDDDKEPYEEWKPLFWRMRRGLAEGDFDEAYLAGDFFCASTCKYTHAISSCYEYVDYKGETFCRFLKCSETIDGCHRTNDFQKLSCKTCGRLFPNCKAGTKYGASSTSD